MESSTVYTLFKNKKILTSGAAYLWNIGCELDKNPETEVKGDQYRIVANALYTKVFYMSENKERNCNGSII